MVLEILLLQTIKYPTQSPDQDDEVTEEDGGRVYWVSTDQQGDFRVGDLFKIEQATGSATLNADALTGLSELKLGSIGAELGASINEFSTDMTLVETQIIVLYLQKTLY